jgi:hypothetical protein
VRSHRPALDRIGASLAAVALALTTTSLPGRTAASTGWQIAFQAHYGTPSSSNVLLGMAALNAADAWAVGGSEVGGSAGVPVAEQWNGKSWRASPLPSGLAGELIAVSAPGATDVWAASFLNGYVLHWNGTAWSVAKNWTQGPHPQNGEITGVTAFSPADVWVFGSSGAFAGIGTWHLIGSTWHKVTGAAGAILLASALSPADMWAITGQNEPQDTIAHYNGSTWRPVTSPALAGLQFHSVLALSDSDIWATALVAGKGGGTPALVHFDGTQWSALPVTVPKPVILLGAVASDGRGGLWIQGESSSSRRPWLVHRTAAGAWSSQHPSAGNGQVEDLTLIPGSTSLWATGALQTSAGADTVIWGHGPAS